jgi:hypothetical protein
MQWLALGLVVIAALSIVFSTLRLGISPMPSNRVQREAVLAEIGEPSGSIYELGAGWGGLALALADRFPSVTVVAFEASPVPFAVLWLRRALWPRKNLQLRRESFLRASLADAKVLVSYLYPGGMAALADKLQREAPDALLVTHTFGVRGWTALRERRLDDLYRTPVYVYRVRQFCVPTAQPPG